MLGNLVPGFVLRAYSFTQPAHGAVFFVGGFLWDAVTLSRIDRLVDNGLLLLYLGLLGGLLVLDRRAHEQRSGWAWLDRRASWLAYGAQFFFGGLFSAYIVFYFQSATLGRSLLFLAFLAGMLVANEFLDKYMRHERIQLAMYFLVAFAFLLFFVPVMTGFPGPGIPAVAGLGALGVASVVTVAIHWEWPGKDVDDWMSWRWPRALLSNLGIWAAMLFTLNFLDCLGVIPPVPLSLQYAGIYHKVTPHLDGYVLEYERPVWYRLPFDRHDAVYHFRENDRVVCFSAVFAPTGMALAVTHRWDHYDPMKGWETTDRIPFSVIGGRGAGFRGYTAKRHLDPGDWRVIVETPTGHELGRVAFTLVPGDAEPPVFWTTVYQ